MEIAAAGAVVLVRDSADPDGPRLPVSASGWNALLASIKGHSAPSDAQGVTR